MIEIGGAIACSAQLMTEIGGAIALALGLALRMTSCLGNAGVKTTEMALLFELFSGGFEGGSSSVRSRVAEEGAFSCSLQEAPGFRILIYRSVTRRNGLLRILGSKLSGHCMCARSCCLLSYSLLICLKRGSRFLNLGPLQFSPCVL